MKNLIYILVLTGVLFAIASCGSGRREADADKKLQYFDERVRPAAAGGTSAAYFTYLNSLDLADTLISVNSPAAGVAQVHESYKTEDGMMGMKEQQEVVVKPGESIVFKQGGLHIMLMNLRKDLEEGDSVKVELGFSQAGEISKLVAVKP